MTANAGQRRPTTVAAVVVGSRCDTSRALGMFFLCFLFYFTLLMFIRTFPAVSTHCQITRASIYAPQARVSTHPHPFWTHQTCLHPQHLFSPTSTRFQLRTPPFHPPKPRFRHTMPHGSFWTCQDLFTLTAISLMPSTFHLTISILCLLALYLNICLFAAPSRGLSRFRGKEESFCTLRIQVPIFFT